MHGGGGERKRKSGPIMFDRNNVGDDEPPPLVLFQEATAKGGGAEESHNDQSLKKVSDKELNERADRAKKMLSQLVLPDGGEKLRASLKSLELEMKQRMLLKDGDNGKKATPVADECTCAGATEGLLTAAPLVVPVSQSTSSFDSHSDLDDERGHRKTKAFREDSPTIINCGHKHARMNVDHPSQSNIEGGQSSISPFDKDPSGCFTEKTKAPHFRPSRSSRRNNQKSVILVDGDELEDDLTDQADKVDNSVKENTIYYPSRDDPKAIEICYSDIECLDPESYLSSTIMNFYIRYLQKTSSPTTTKRCNHHFFNTYFYKKLQLDVLNKVDKEISFVKFRRWWKGVNIFEKAYIFIPIHESLHWSLVIICIPDKEDESGPIILHLDSLGLHPSKLIFKNMKSFLIEEWKFMRKGKVLPELPIADKVWDKLSRRIDVKVIEVPQQRNEYDCGLFVLFFMEHFLDDAPERLKKKDLDMFGRQWFKPEQASCLRPKIRDLLKEEFVKAKNGISNLDL